MLPMLNTNAGSDSSANAYANASNNIMLTLANTSYTDAQYQY